jgi:hypothetical protein
MSLRFFNIDFIFQLENSNMLIVKPYRIFTLNEILVLRIHQANDIIATVTINNKFDNGRNT